MKVSELTGPLLDLWVAKTEGRCLHERTEHWAIEDGNDYESGFRCLDCGKDTYGEFNKRNYLPSTNWSQGGPIIEREGVLVRPWGRNPDGSVLSWCACVRKKKSLMWSATYVGATTLIAAMRCFVASVYGEEVADE